MSDKYRCYDMWTVGRLNSGTLGRKGWKEKADWCPCNFSYEEERQRVETFHYEEEVFQQISGVGDDDEEVASSAHWSNYEEETFISNGGSEEEPTGSFNQGEEPSLSYSVDNPEENGGGDDQQEDSTSESVWPSYVDGGETTFSSEFTEDVQEQCENQWASEEWNS